MAGLIERAAAKLAEGIAEHARAKVPVIAPVAIGSPVSRVDGIAKVTGAATYATDVMLEDMVHAVLVTSTIARGRIAAIDTTKAASLPGVVTMFTHKTMPRLKRNRVPQIGAGRWSLGRDPRPLQDERIHYAGQPVALVVAETFEQACEAARAVSVTYEAEPAATALEAVLAVGAAEPPKLRLGHADYARGDVGAALASAVVRIEAEYTTPPQTNNPLGLFATVAAWDDDTLTLYDANQSTGNVAKSAASVLGLSKDDVRVSSPFVGGAFGAGLRAWPHAWLAAVAARETGRPVKLVLTRQQMFTSVGRRAETVHRVTLGAEQDGRLVAIRHEGTHDTSREENFTEALTTATRYLYASPNVETRYRTARLDRATPTYMRCPGESETLFALESALDELAIALDMDPIALRLRNEPERDEEKDRPWSSRSLRDCYERGAELFDWARRTPKPGSMREGNVLVGLGVATGTYPAFVLPASAYACIDTSGTAVIRSAVTDIGPGTATALTQVAADALGLPLDRITVEIGDSSFPKAPQQGASMIMATVGSAVYRAGSDLRGEFVKLAAADRQSPLYGCKPEDVIAGDGLLSARGDPSRSDTFAAILTRAGRDRLELQATSRPLAPRLTHSCHAFAAQFVEVHIDLALRTIRVPRLLGVFAAGRIVSPKLAHSQLSGGMIWGLSQALLEETTYDHRLGRIVNASLGDYLVPVHADMGNIEVEVIPEQDPYVNPLGVKGVGELGMAGVAPAIANAVYHATGIRIRQLPITMEKLLGNESRSRGVEKS